MCLVGRSHGLLELLLREELVALCLERVSHGVYREGGVRRGCRVSLQRIAGVLAQAELLCRNTFGLAARMFDAELWRETGESLCVVGLKGVTPSLPYPSVYSETPIQDKRYDALFLWPLPLYV